MGRKKTTEFSGENLFDAMVAAQLERTGGAGLTGPEADACIIGLQLPALSLRYLFKSTVFPLGRITVLTGTQASCKSSFLYEMCRWHRDAKGGAYLEETENKDSADLRLSLTKWDPGAIRTTQHSTVDEWMSAVSKRFDEVKDFCEGTKAKPGPGRRVLYAQGVDSLTALLSQGTNESIDKSGVPDRRYPIETGMISTWLKKAAPAIYGWPVSYILTNHDKPTTNQQTGQKEDHMPGGMAPKFHATYIVVMKRIGTIETADFEGRRIKFKMMKNSLGPDGTTIDANMLWRQDIVETAEGPMARQVTFWDWHTASIDMLLARMDHKLKTVANRIKGIIDLHPVSGRKLWSDALAIPKDSPVTYRKAGQVLEGHEELLKHLYGVLGIRQRAVYQPGVDLLEQMDEAKEYAREHCHELPALTDEPTEDGELPADEGYDDDE